MALTGAQASALLVLLEAPSKQAVDAFFCSCFRERQRHAAGPIDDARVAEIVESLGLSTPLAAAPLQRAAIALIGKVLYADASAEQTAALFPPDFHSSLQALLTKVVPSRWLTRRPPCGSATRPPPPAAGHPNPNPNPKQVQHHKEEWRAESLAAGSVSTMPQLAGTSWQVFGLGSGSGLGFG